MLAEYCSACDDRDNTTFSNKKAGIDKAEDYNWIDRCANGYNCKYKRMGVCKYFHDSHDLRHCAYCLSKGHMRSHCPERKAKMMEHIARKKAAREEKADAAEAKIKKERQATVAAAEAKVTCIAAKEAKRQREQLNTAISPPYHNTPPYPPYPYHNTPPYPPYQYHNTPPYPPYQSHNTPPYLPYQYHNTPPYLPYQYHNTPSYQPLF